MAVLAAPLVLFGLLTAAWALFGPDDQASDVAPNVTVAGVEVGGSTPAQLAAAVDELATSFETTPVVIRTPDFTIRDTAGDMGLSVDREGTVAGALATGRDDPGPLGPIRWLKSLLVPRAAPVELHVDRARATDAIVEGEGDRRTVPVEPTMTVTRESITLNPGADGRQLDIDEILDELPSAASDVGRRIVVEAEQAVVSPTLADDAVQAVVDQATAATSHPLTVKWSDQSAEIDGDDLRAGFRLRVEGDTARLALDPAYVSNVLGQKLLQPANPTGVTFDIVDGVPTPVPGHDAVVCCDEQAPADLADALLAGRSEVTLGTRTVTAAEGVEWARGLGVKEVVGEFTTRHPCCANRVKNIHRMADLTRGVLIPPGETFSANGHVGRRTVEKGFFNAPVIDEGQYKDDIGGGVSQWATTTFNAAFFAGLDIPEYKAHSIYISRYPFGREATLAYPSIDLQIRNNTPYGVVIWPTYTSTSITVQMWSTRYAIGTQSAISKTSGCGTVTTTRTRLYTNGTSDSDKFRADYTCNPPAH